MTIGCSCGFPLEFQCCHPDGIEPSAVQRMAGAGAGMFPGCSRFLRRIGPPRRKTKVEGVGQIDGLLIDMEILEHEGHESPQRLGQENR